MNVGDIVEVQMRIGTIVGKVLKSSDLFQLDFEDISSHKKYYIGIVPGLGNPKVKVTRRLNRGKRVPTSEYLGYK